MLLLLVVSYRFHKDDLSFYILRICSISNFRKWVASIWS